MSSRHPTEPFAAGKSRKGTSFAVEFPTMPTLQRKPFEVQLIQKRNNHDILKLTFSQEGKQWFEDIPTGLPIKFSWTQEGVQTFWFGYVSYVSKIVTALRIKTMEVVCVGASFPLKEKLTKVFSDVSIPEVVAQLATDFGLEFLGDNHPRKFPQLTIAGHSCWAWIQEQANRIGYAAYVDGTTLYFRSLDKLISQNSAAIPVLSIEDKSTPDGQLFYDRTLEYFKVLRGDFIEEDGPLRTEKHTGGINPLTGELFTSSASPQSVGNNLRASSSKTLFQEYRNDQVALSNLDSNIAANDSAQLSRFTLPAKAKGRGDYRLRPYALVQVLGTGDVTDGYWLVKDVTHTFGKFNTYDVELSLLSDGTGASELSGFELPKSSGRDTVNIAAALSAGSSPLTSSRATNPSRLGNGLTALTHAELGFSAESSKWIAG